MTVPVQSQIFNPITGVFGTGQMQVFGAGQSGSWYVPNGIGKVRVRLWGGGAGSTSVAGGGGFALKTIYDLSGVTSIPVSVGAGGNAGSGGTSSFGSYVSATGGTTGGTGGSGVGGDINSSGGTVSSGAGGAGSLFGNGGSNTAVGASGAGNNTATSPSPSYSNGFLGAGGNYSSTTSIFNYPSSGISSQFSIDFIGTGGGGTYILPGINGGGGGGAGGFPGGGSSGTNLGASGLVIVEF